MQSTSKKQSGSQSKSKGAETQKMRVNLSDAGMLLMETLLDEKAADQNLTVLALNGVNMDAASQQS